jgi:hypothetical protein
MRKELKSVWSSTAKKVAIAFFSHPSGAREVAFPRASGSFRFARGINVEHELRDLSPIRSFRVSIEQTQIGDGVPFIVAS